MPAKPAILHELRALEAYRLEHDLTYQQLADEMTAAGYVIGRGTIHLLITGKHKPLARTLYKVRKFLGLIEVARRDRVRGRPDGDAITGRP